MTIEVKFQRPGAQPHEFESQQFETMERVQAWFAGNSQGGLHTISIYSDERKMSDAERDALFDAVEKGLR